jgi:hypothetical protein
VIGLYVHAMIALIGLLVILEGGLLGAFPNVFHFLGGPGHQFELPHWTRLQGAGFMLLGSGFVLAGVPPPGVNYELPVVVLAVAACVMFSLAVLRRGAARLRLSPA